MMNSTSSIVHEDEPSESVTSIKSNKEKAWITLGEICDQYYPLERSETEPDYLYENSLVGKLHWFDFDPGRALQVKIEGRHASQIAFLLDRLVSRVDALKLRTEMNESDARDARILELKAENAALRANSLKRLNEFRNEINKLYRKKFR